MERSNFMEVAGEAAEHRKAATTPDVENQKKFGSSDKIDKDLFKYFFDLQVKLEREGAAQGKGMDYIMRMPSACGTSS